VPAQHFQTFWLQPRLSPLEYLCLASFVAHGHELTLYSYERIANVPPGCRLEDARELLPQDAVFTYPGGPLAGSVAAFANLFRYKLLRDRGGWWVDTDTLCLRGDLRDTEYVFVRIDDETFANGLLKAPAGSPFASAAFERAAAQGRDVEWLGNGPRLVTQLVGELGLEGHAWETRELLPLSWDEALAVLDPHRADELEERLADSVFVHLWNQMFMVYNVLKTARPPAGSLLDRLYDRYDVPFPAEPRYEWRDLSYQVALQREHWQLSEEIERLGRELEAAHSASPPRRRSLLGRLRPDAP
jgi:hypothetical protein